MLTTVYLHCFATIIWLIRRSTSGTAVGLNMVHNVVALMAFHAVFVNMHVNIQCHVISILVLLDHPEFDVGFIL